MYRYKSNYLSFRRLAGILVGLILIVFGGFYFFNVSAQTEAVKNPAEQNLVIGRLAFSSRIAGPTIPDGELLPPILTAGQTILLTPASLIPQSRVVSRRNKSPFAHWQQPKEIYVVNANGSGQ